MCYLGFDQAEIESLEKMEFGLDTLIVHLHLVLLHFIDLHYVYLHLVYLHYIDSHYVYLHLVHHTLRQLHYKMSYVTFCPTTSGQLLQTRMLSVKKF